MTGWQINRGVDQTADYVRVSQLTSQLFRPDIVDEALRHGSVEQAVAATGARFHLNDLLRIQLPHFFILHPDNGFSTRHLPLQVVLNVNVGEFLDFTAYINDRRINQRGPGWSLPERTNSMKKILDLPLDPGKNRIRIVAANPAGFTAEKVLEVFFHKRIRGKARGTLYLLAVGVSEYADSSLRLNYAADDARAVHQRLTAQAGRAYTGVKSLLLADGAKKIPDADNIRDALALFEQATDKDTTVLFLAGHGVNQGGEYYFLPQNAQRRNGKWRRSSVVRWDEIQDAVANARGRRLLLVDTCHAGNAFNARMLKEAADADILVFSATDGDSLAEERPNLKHGIFTHALLESLSKKGDGIPDGLIRVAEINAYLSSRVLALSDEMQTPVLHAPAGFKDFIFAHVK
ncbi:MAG: hypothetical protein GY862_08020 [Gammaproteobacteria bacterium]|nr:hypothetical protein [Gammaproteobacteria bacterium]